MASAPSKPALLHPQQRESIARDFVARHPGNVKAWVQLVDIVLQNLNPVEAARLGEQALRRFPDHARLRVLQVHAQVGARRIPEAIRLLDQSMLRGRTTPTEMLLMAELIARDRPGVALRLVEMLMDHLPGHQPYALFAQGLRARLSVPPQQPCVGILLDADWHSWVFESLGQALADLGQGFIVAQHPSGLVANRPEVVILCSPMPQRMAELRARLPRSRIINTRHGVSINGKNYGLYAAAACDHVCVSSPTFAEELANRALLEPDRLWVTGYPQMDGLWRLMQSTSNATQARPSRTVMFAPTFNEYLSAAFVIGDDPVRALRGDDESIHVILTGHPYLRQQTPGLLEGWQKLAQASRNVEYVDSARVNAVTQLARADVLVSDVSSMATQFLALKRPLVRLLDPVRAANSGAHREDEDDAQIQAVSVHVQRVGDVAAAVRSCLQQPGQMIQSEALSALHSRLFGHLTDGRAGERIAQRVAPLLAAAGRSAT